MASTSLLYLYNLFYTSKPTKTQFYDNSIPNF